MNGISETKLDTNFDLYYSYDWPGNVRELRNLVERISILSMNEEKINTNTLVKDSLSQKSFNVEEDDYKNTLSYSLKEARQKFEKKLSIYPNLKKIKEIFLKQQNL